MLELNVTAIIENFQTQGNAVQFSGSCEESALLKTNELKHAAREHFKGYGAWSDEEIDAWPDEKLEAITFQDITASYRESIEDLELGEQVVGVHRGRFSGRLSDSRHNLYEVAENLYTELNSLVERLKETEDEIDYLDVRLQIHGGNATLWSGDSQGDTDHQGTWSDSEVGADWDTSDIWDTVENLLDNNDDTDTLDQNVEYYFYLGE